MTLLHTVMDTLRPPARAGRPAVVRLGVGVFAAVDHLRRRATFRRLNAEDPSLFAPVGPVRLLRRPLPVPVANLLVDAAWAVNLLATAGVAHRVTGPTNAALQLWTLSYRNSWSMIYHNDNQLVLHQMILGLSPSADALNVDALRRNRPAGPPRERRIYGAIPVACNVATVAVYVISGVAKVRSPLGWSWARGAVLKDQIGADAVRKAVFGSRESVAAGPMYRGGAVLTVLSAGALAIELGSPLALTRPAVGRLFGAAAWGMHAGIRAVMGIKFTYNLSGVSYLSLLVHGTGERR